MAVRRATSADIDDILKLAKAFVASFELSETAFRTSFAELVAADDAVLLVAELRGKVVG
jgi:hypothetical protein